MYLNENTTVQWSIVAESMMMTTHQKGRHGYGGVWGGNNRELASIAVDGAPLPDFDPATTEYKVEVQDPNAIPVVSAEPLSNVSQVSVEQATAIPGKAVVSVTAMDGGVRVYAVELFAADTTPPTLQLEVDKPILKPGGHRMETIRVTPHATDEGTGIASIQLVSIVSSEPDDGIGDGNTTGDIQGAEYGTADYEFQLRAERSGQGEGRIYTITYEAADHAGNRKTAAVTVRVEH